MPQAIIAAGQSASGPLDLKAESLLGLFIPAEFDGTSLTFQAAPALAGPYVDVLTPDGTTYTLTVSPSRYCRVGQQGYFFGIRYLRVVSDATESAERILDLATDASRWQFTTSSPPPPSPPPPPPPSSTLLTDLISYWPLDEVSGTRADAHASLDLTDNNTVGSTAGKIGNAADFEADNSEYLSASADPTLDIQGSDFTVACWFNLESDPGVFNQVTLVCRRPGGGSFELRVVNNNPDLIAQFSFVDAVSVSWGTALSLATWYYLVVWRSVADGKIYISVNDGTPVEAACAVDEAGGAADFALGARFLTTASLFHDGLLDEVGIWGRVLTSTERTDLYNGGAGLAYPFS